MPKSIPRKQNKSRKSNRGTSMVAAPPTWAPGSSGTELKYFKGDGANFNLYHSSPLTYLNDNNLLNQIVVGNTVSTRVGNRIFLKELQIFLVCNNKADRPNVTYRLSVCAAPAATNTDAYAELFGSTYFTANHIPVNSQLLYDAHFPHNQGATMSAPTKERSHVHCMTLAINKPVVYNSDGNATTRLIAFVNAFDSYGTLITDNIASIPNTSFRMLYTDA